MSTTKAPVEINLVDALYTASPHLVALALLLLSLTYSPPSLSPSPLLSPSTSDPFQGNPAGVCYLPSHSDWSTVSPAWMQSVALEMNQAETAFLIPLPTTSTPTPTTSSFLLRWFTPAAEVDLCGHATLASSHYLFTTHIPHTHTIHFSTRSGTLIARTVASPSTPSSPASPPPSSPLIEISLPSDPPHLVSPSSPEALTTLPLILSSFHLPTPSSTTSSPLPLLKGKFDYLIELPSPSAVLSLTPDFSTMRQISSRGVGVTARGGPHGVDFTSRFFAPALGIDEDPVTGSAHCMLAEYWGGRLGKEEMVGYQASARGGMVRVRRDGDRVRLQGYGVHTMKGTLLV